jgi:hypothetical protein
MALDYLEYAESIAQTENEFLQIMAIIKSAGDIANISFSTEPIPANSHEAVSLLSPSSVSHSSSPRSPPPLSTSASQAQIAKMFYQRTTRGGDTDDFLYDDYLELYERIKDKAMRNGGGGGGSSLNQLMSPLSLKPSPQEISLHPSTSLHHSSKSYCVIS